VRFLITIFIILIVLEPATRGQISIKSNFDNGHVEVLFAENDTVKIAASSFLHFRITGVKDKIPVFVTSDDKDEIFNNSHRMVFRYSHRPEWHYFDMGRIDKNQNYTFENYTPFVCDTVYISYWFPWTYSDMENSVRKIDKNPYVKNCRVVGHSRLGNNIYGYQVTDTTIPDKFKKQVVILGRQHANEPLGNYILNGITEYLINSEDEQASLLRQQAIFHFYPMVNPDGVYYGRNFSNQPDHNDAWFKGSPEDIYAGNLEVNILRKDILQETGGTADFAFDVHSQPGHCGKYYWWGIAEKKHADCHTSASLVYQIARFDKETGSSTFSIANNYVSIDLLDMPGPWADYWMYSNLGAVSYTLEPGSSPSVLPIERIKALGAAIAKGLSHVISSDSEFTELPGPASEVITNTTGKGGVD